jgi:hypothetical protein
VATVLGDLVDRERRSDRAALRIDARGRERSYRDVCTTAWKTGHALRHLGVHADARVALAADATPQPLLTLFGAACLGARVTFDVAAAARVVLVPVDREDEVADRPGRKVVVYGGAPSDPGVVHWEEVVWSENPAMPPGDPSPDDPALDRADGSSLDHRTVLSRADRIAREAGLGSGTAVALRASLADPRAVIAGVVAPLLVGGTVVLPDAGTTADVAVGEAGPEPERIDLEAV